MPSLPLPGMEFHDQPKYGRFADTTPVATVWTVANPGKAPIAFIIRVPDIWGPFCTSEELNEMWRSLRQSGII